MIELAKLIHSAIGTDSSRGVIIALASIGAVLFGLLGWLVNAAYISGLPKFDINMQSLNIGLPGPPHDPNKNSLVVLVVTISNSRAQSIALDWNLFVRVSGSADFNRALPIPMGDSLVLTGSDPSSNRTYKGQDALYLKTISKPIQAGDGVSGVLQFIVPGITREQLLLPDTAFKLCVRDAFKKEHCATKTRREFVNEIHFPVVTDRRALSSSAISHT